MKAIIYFPAHPAYFDNEYTQEELDVTFSFHQGWRDTLVKVSPAQETKIVMLTTPAGRPTVILDREDATEMPVTAKLHEQQVRMEQVFCSTIQQVKSIMDCNRRSLRG